MLKKNINICVFLYKSVYNFCICKMICNDQPLQYLSLVIGPIIHRNEQQNRTSASTQIFLKLLYPLTTPPRVFPKTLQTPPFVTGFVTRNSVTIHHSATGHVPTRLHNHFSLRTIH